MAVTVDLFAHCRRGRIRLRPAFVRAGLHLAPWLVLIAIVYFANLVGLLPHSPDAVIPPDSRLAATPRYLRVVVLVALMLLAYAYAVAVERRLERRFATDARATLFVSHLLLVLIALLLLLVNPYAVLLVLPAAILWPLARPGGWARSILPVYLGLLMVPVAARLLRRCSSTRAGRSGGTSSCSSRTARSRWPRCCWPRCSSPRPECSRTRCTSAASRRARSPGRPWTAAARTG